MNTTRTSTIGIALLALATLVATGTAARADEAFPTGFQILARHQLGIDIEMKEHAHTGKRLVGTAVALFTGTSAEPFPGPVHLTFTAKRKKDSWKIILRTRKRTLPVFRAVLSVSGGRANRGRLFFKGTYKIKCSPRKWQVNVRFAEGHSDDPGNPGGGGNVPPVALFDLDPTVGPAPLDVHFDARASHDPDGPSGGVEQAAWEFGDGAHGTGIQVDHTFDHPGSYTVILEVTDDRGAPATTSATVRVEEPVVVPTPPAAPGSVLAESTSPATVLVTWEDRSHNEDGFRVERATGDGAYETVAEFPPDFTQHIDMGLASGAEFTYCVTAVNSVGSSNRICAPVVRTPRLPTVGYRIEVPLHATTNETFEVVLTPLGMASSNGFIQESRDPEFVTYESTFVNPASWPLRVRLGPKAAGTYYYRGGGGGMPMSAVTEITVESAGPATVRLFAKYDNCVMQGLFNGDDTEQSSTCFAHDNLVVGNVLMHFENSSTWLRFGSLLYFDLTSLIGEATITKATLRLYCHRLAESFDTSYTLGACSDDWDPRSVSWNTKPRWWFAGQVDFDPPVATSVPIEIDVTPIVHQWVSGAWANYGFEILDTNLPSDGPLRTSYFDSLEGWFAYDRRPQLEITYTSN